MFIELFKKFWATLTTSQIIQLKKTVSWRIISLVIVCGVTWVVSGSIELTLKIGIFDTLLKMLSYYGHERYWHRKYKAAKKLLKEQKDTNE